MIEYVKAFFLPTDCPLCLWGRYAAVMLASTAFATWIAAWPVYALGVAVGAGVLLLKWAINANRP